MSPTWQCPLEFVNWRVFAIEGGVQVWDAPVSLNHCVDSEVLFFTDFGGELQLHHLNGILESFEWDR